MAAVIGPSAGGQVEVQQHGQAIVAQQNVGWLDIAMEHTALMSMCQPICQFRNDPQRQLCS